MMRNRYRFVGVIIATIAVAFISKGAFAQDQGPAVSTDETVQSQHLSAESQQHTIYASPADRAKDALLVTEVKAAIFNDGVADDGVITVGAAHGVVTLTGELGSQQDVDHAIALAQNCDGVKKVENKLTVEKGPAAD